MAPIFQRLATLLTLLPTIVSALPALTLRMNNPACRSPVASRTTPVVLIHGLFGNKDNDLKRLGDWLEATHSFCTYSLTYGEQPQYPGVGGLKHIKETAPVIAAFINQVLAETGARKVDLIGHSEGGLQSFYVPKFESSVKNKIRNIAALAPVSHGTTLQGINTIAYEGGPVTVSTIDLILTTGGCEACIDLRPDGAATVALNNGPIIQKFVDKVLIIATQYDALVTPVGTASFINEPKVTNMFIQDRCPTDTAGHHNVVNDPNVWDLVANFLDTSIPVPSVCVVGQTPLKN